MLTVASVVAHPSLRAARPRVVAGEGGLERRVRWIHSSEVLEIAPLLQGGELLLTGGQVLSGVDPSAQERYVRELAERRVAAVAIETGSVLTSVPEAVVRVADELGFPVVELRGVVPFVSVAEAVNGELVNDSVTRLRFGGELAHALSVILGQRGGVQPLLEELARRSQARVTLLDPGGTEMAAAGPDGRPESEEDAADLSGGAVTTRIAVRGAHLATLAIYPLPGADLDLLATAGDRAVEALALALLRISAPTPRDVAGSELARSAHRPELARRVVRLGETAGFRDAMAVVGVVVEGWRQGRPGLPGLDTLLRAHGVVAMDMGDVDVRVVLGLADRRHAEQSRRQLLADLSEWAGAQRELVISVGPTSGSLGDVAVSMRAALAAVRGTTTYGSGVVIDASATMLTDWLVGDESRAQAAEFVQGQLASVLALGPSESSAVLETLECYLDSGCHKTRTAELLHVRRQSLYARLDKAFSVLGGDPTGTPRALPLHVALKLRHGLQLFGISGS